MKTQPSIKFYAVSCTAHKDLCKEQKVNSYPKVKLFKEGSYEPIQGGVLITKDTILKDLGFAEGGDSDGGSDGKNSGAKKKLRKADNISTKSGADHKEKEKVRVIPFRERDVHDAWSDASTSFEFALKNGIYMENGPLATEKSKAFRDWLELLSETLPSQMVRTHDIIAAIPHHCFTRLS